MNEFSSSDDDDDEEWEAATTQRLEAERHALLCQIIAGTGSRRLRRTTAATNSAAVLQLRLCGIESRLQRRRRRGQ